MIVNAICFRSSRYLWQNLDLDVTDKLHMHLRVTPADMSQTMVFQSFFCCFSYFYKILYCHQSWSMLGIHFLRYFQGLWIIWQSVRPPNNRIVLQISKKFDSLKCIWYCKLPWKIVYKFAARSCVLNCQQGHKYLDTAIDTEQIELMGLISLGFSEV